MGFSVHLQIVASTFLHMDFSFGYCIYRALESSRITQNLEAVIYKSEILAGSLKLIQRAHGSLKLLSASFLFYKELEFRTAFVSVWMGLC